MKHWKHRISDKCPRCGDKGEDTTNNFLCNGKKAKTLRNTKMIGLEEWMTNLKTCPYIIVRTCDQLRA